MKIKEKIEDLIKKFSTEKIKIISSGSFGDFSITPGDLSKLSSDQDKVLKLFKSKLNEEIEVRSENGYINFYLKEKIILEELHELMSNQKYFLLKEAHEKTIIFDYSSPNIAKPFSVGHLRSTVIGQANLNIHKLLGYKTIGINHVGDWGTQFGKLIFAIKEWGNQAEIEKEPISQLNRLYVMFHQKAEEDESLNEKAREWFRKLETGDDVARKIWEMCVKWSMEEFNKTYKLLNIEIGNVQGESFYEDKIQEVINELNEKNLLKKSKGAQIVEIEGMPPAIIQKTNESTLYLTRDLAALKYRIETYDPDEIIYHVGNDQTLHFLQLKAVAQKLGILKKVKITFAGHGLIRLESGKMSTRKGQTILLEDIILKAEEEALKIIDQKNSDLENKKNVARTIAISAIKYADLATNRKSDILFSFDKIVTLKGNSGPYLQYTYARVLSIIRKFEEQYPGAKAQKYLPSEAVNLAREIIFAKEKIKLSAQNSTPSVVCDLLYSIAEEFNNFYEKKKIITASKPETEKNIYIIFAVEQILSVLFELLGLEKLEKI